MAGSSSTSSPAGSLAAARDDVSVARWFACYAGVFAALALPLAWIISQQHWTWADWRYSFTDTFAGTPVAIKLLAFCLYLSLCTTFLPLPTGWIVAGVAAREAAVGGDVWMTTLLVALVGAAGSTIANLNDYHFFTWLLRNKRLASVRDTGTYAKAAAWFARSPFFLLFVFNVIPIPIDVVRLLAITNRYPRVAFAAANLLGGIVR